MALLTLGAALGLGSALAGILLPTGSGAGLPSNAVAMVNGAPIRRADYLRLVAALESDMRSPVDDELRRRVLDRMIDEELLVQRALELGLAEIDRRVRSNLTAAIVASVVSDSEAREPDERELREFHQENLDFFTSSGRLRVRQIFFRVPVRGGDLEEVVRARARDARVRLLAGEPFATVRDEVGDAEISPVPDALLPPAKLRDYLGATALRQATELAVGEVGEPVRSGTGIHLLQVIERADATVRPFESIRSQVYNEWRRRQGDLALRDYLDFLRGDGEVVIATPLE